MTDHYERAKRRLAEAEVETAWQASGPYASMATAHAVLALIDIIQGDRETEIQDAEQLIVELEHENRSLKIRVRELADQLDGCNDTLRRHEQAATNEAAATNNQQRKSHE